MSIYTYSIRTNITVQKLAPSRLTKEIQASSIGVALIGITTRNSSMGIEFSSAISGPEKTTLDGLVLNHSGKEQSKNQVDIFREIISSAEPVTQRPRILDGLDKNATFFSALADNDYSLATSRLNKAKTAGDITQADVDLIVSKFP